VVNNEALQDSVRPPRAVTASLPDTPPLCSENRQPLKHKNVKKGNANERTAPPPPQQIPGVGRSAGCDRQTQPVSRPGVAARTSRSARRPCRYLRKYMRYIARIQRRAPSLTCQLPCRLRWPVATILCHGFQVCMKTGINAATTLLMRCCDRDGCCPAHC
jgi:hypothetical protein